MKVLIIGDPHAHPRYDNKRFRWLGLHIAHTRPDVVVCMGDFGDWPSLCKHASPKEKEGSRVLADKRAIYDALQELHAPIREYNVARRALRKRRYQPRWLMTLGNHDHRPFDLGKDEPRLEALLDESYQPFWDEGWELHNFKKPVSVGGFVFCHYFPSGTMGRPIGGKNHTASLLASGHQSCVVGHDHRFAITTSTRFDGSRIHAISAGCFVHPRYSEAWCAQTEPMWHRGVLMLEDVDKGDFGGYTWTTMQALEARYASK